MKKIIGIVLLVLTLVAIVHKPSRGFTLKQLYKVGLVDEVCSNAEVVGDIVLPIYKCSYKLKIFPFVSYCHIGWSGRHCHFLWEEKHIH